MLYEYQKTIVLKSSYLQVEETTAAAAAIKVLDHDNKKGKTHLGEFRQPLLLAYHDPLGAQAFFSYEPGRGGKYPTTMLKNFNGYLQTDVYAG